MRRFAPGEPVVWRSIDPTHGVATVWARTVVEDTDDLIVLYTPNGSPGKQRTGQRGGPRGRMLLEWDGRHRDLVWERTNALLVHRPGDHHSLWLAWDAASWEPTWRYIDLQEPWRRTPIGFDSRDLWLDLWAEPRRDEWHWKDDDELAWLVEQGRVDQARAIEIRSIGERALETVLRREPPLDRDWTAWRPDPSWAIPALPPDWKERDPTPR